MYKNVKEYIFPNHFCDLDTNSETSVGLVLITTSVNNNYYVNNNYNCSLSAV